MKPRHVAADASPLGCPSFPAPTAGCTRSWMLLFKKGSALPDNGQEIASSYGWKLARPHAEARVGDCGALAEEGGNGPAKHPSCGM